MAAERDHGKKPRIPVNEATLADAALAYLNRTDASRDKLASKLEAWVRRRGEPSDPTLARPLIAALLARYQASGLVDDGRLARTAVERLRSRGASSRAISYRLRQHGVEASAIESALATDGGAKGASELEAARALVRRRKLGPHRAEADRKLLRRKDLATLARAGFDFDTALRALGPIERDDDDF